MHRDLKLENLLLVAPKDTSRLKIADFGWGAGFGSGLWARSRFWVVKGEAECSLLVVLARM